MIQAIVDLFSSKKFITALVAVAVIIAAKLGWQLDAELLIAIAIASLFGILLHAQGQADHGKEAARIYADADGDGIPDDEDETPIGDTGITNGNGGGEVKLEGTKL